MVTDSLQHSSSAFSSAFSTSTTRLTFSSSASKLVTFVRISSRLWIFCVAIAFAFVALARFCLLSCISVCRSNKYASMRVFVSAFSSLKFAKSASNRVEISLNFCACSCVKLRLFSKAALRASKAFNNAVFSTSISLSSATNSGELANVFKISLFKRSLMVAES